MATPDLTAATVMDQSAALLNDVAKTVYTYVAQMPYLNMALQELQEIFELNNVPVTDTISDVIACTTATTAIGYATSPALPEDMIEPQRLWEAPTGQESWVPMTKVDSLPLYQTGVAIPRYNWYVWNSQEIRVLAANQPNDIKIEYIRNLFTLVTDENTQLAVINAATFLEYRTASLCSEFIGENTTRSSSLNSYAVLGLDRVTGIGAKGRQAILTRRRPFRSAYKRRTYA